MALLLVAGPRRNLIECANGCQGMRHTDHPYWRIEDSCGDINSKCLANSRCRQRRGDRKVTGISKQTPNEVRLIHLPTSVLIATMNTRTDDKPADSTAR